MQTPTITPTPTVTNPQQITPLLEAMTLANDQMPNNSLPADTNGTVQENAEQAAHPPVTLYNAHGILVKSKPNSLIAIA